MATEENPELKRCLDLQNLIEVQVEGLTTLLTMMKEKLHLSDEEVKTDFDESKVTDEKKYNITMYKMLNDVKLMLKSENVIIEPEEGKDVKDIREDGKKKYVEFLYKE